VLFKFLFHTQRAALPHEFGFPHLKNGGILPIVLGSCLFDLRLNEVKRMVERRRNRSGLILISSAIGLIYSRPPLLLGHVQIDRVDGLI
jgi:hypothetical protein